MRKKDDFRTCKSESTQVLPEEYRDRNGILMSVIRAARVTGQPEAELSPTVQYRIASYYSPLFCQEPESKDVQSPQHYIKPHLCTSLLWLHRSPQPPAGWACLFLQRPGSCLQVFERVEVFPHSCGNWKHQWRNRERERLAGGERRQERGPERTEERALDSE